MPDFTHVPGEGLRVHLDIDEARLLREVCGEMKTLLEADIPRADPVMQRLFPDAFEDPTEAENFRELIGGDLHAHKVDALRTVTERLGPSGPLDSSIPEDEIEAWLTLLTDIRLAIGVRLDITEDRMASDIHPADPDAPALSVLHWLGWLQGSILEALESP